MELPALVNLRLFRLRAHLMSDTIRVMMNTGISLTDQWLNGQPRRVEARLWIINGWM